MTDANANSPRNSNIGPIDLSPESARVIGAAISAGTSGPGFLLLRAFGIAVAAAFLAAGVGGALYCASVALGGQAGALEALGLSLFVCALSTIVLTVQLRWNWQVNFAQPQDAPPGSADQAAAVAAAHIS